MRVNVPLIGELAIIQGETYQALSLQSTKPTTRGDGSALVIGDRWWKVDEGTEWFWNGTYWLSQHVNQSTQGSLINAGTSLFAIELNLQSKEPLFAQKSNSVFIHQVSFYVRSIFLNWDGSNYYTLQSIF